MRYNIVINQERCKKFGVNLTEAAMMDLFNQLSSWANDEIIEGKTYYHISRNKVIEELPLFLTKPDTVYRNFKSLQSKKLIEYRKEKGKDFIRLSPSGKTWNKLGFKSENNTNSDSNPSKFGFKSENKKQVNSTEKQKVNPLHSDSNPTYNIYNYTINNSLREILDQINEENRLVIDGVLTDRTWHERFMMTAKSEGLKIEFEKDVLPVIFHWLKNKWMANGLNKPLTQLRSEASSYALKVIQNGGLKVGKHKEEKSSLPVYLRKIS